MSRRKENAGRKQERIMSRRRRDKRRGGKEMRKGNVKMHILCVGASWRVGRFTDQSERYSVPFIDGPMRAQNRKIRGSGTRMDSDTLALPIVSSKSRQGRSFKKLMQTMPNSGENLPHLFIYLSVVKSFPRIHFWEEKLNQLSV